MKRKYIIGILLAVLMVCAVVSFADTVSAAKWKKYDSGKFSDNYPPVGYKIGSKYQSYVKGDNKLYVNYYNFKKGTNKKHLGAKWTFTKIDKKTIKLVEQTDFKKKNTYYLNSKFSVKKTYKLLNKEHLKILSKHPKKIAFDKKSFTSNGVKVNSYAFGNNDVIQVIIRKSSNDEEFCTVSMEKNKNKVTIEKFNNKRNSFYKTSFKSNESLKNIYYDFINDLMKS